MGRRLLTTPLHNWPGKNMESDSVKTGGHSPKETFSCLAIALSQTMEQTAEMFADHFVSAHSAVLLNVPPPHPVSFFLGVQCVNPHEE